MTVQDQENIFRRWLEEYTGLIFKVVRTCAGTPQDQDDLFQDVLVQVWSSIPAFRGEAKETTWIYRVAFNTALAWRRGERRRREGLPQQTPANQPESNPDQETIDRLYAAIRRLSKVDASLALMHLDGVSYREIAGVLGISENYVGVKLNRIRKQLADELKGATHGV